ncbi:hypothetical protein [Cribrihabitans neustonicus]|uniref:hypothetical protein n=1 Tax=Cribrihabitans neustonicus TaxID=1429085 RepID=UPI003B5A958E
MAKFEISDAKGSGIAISVHFSESDKSVFKTVAWNPDEASWSAAWQPRWTIMTWLKEAEEEKIQPDDCGIESLKHGLASPRTLSADEIEILEEIQRVTGLCPHELDSILDELHGWEVITEKMIAGNAPGAYRDEALAIVKCARRPMLLQAAQRMSAYCDIEMALVPSHGPEAVPVH